MKNIKLTESQFDLLKMGTTFHSDKLGTFYFLPFWFKQTDNHLDVELISLKSIPEEIKGAIREASLGRGKSLPLNNGRPLTYDECKKIKKHL